MNTSRKVVQARMYAQALMLGIWVVSAGFEMDDARRARGGSVSSNDPSGRVEASARKENYQGQDLWKDMAAVEERRLSTKEGAEKAFNDALSDVPLERYGRDIM